MALSGRRRALAVGVLGAAFLCGAGCAAEATTAGARVSEKQWYLGGGERRSFTAERVIAPPADLGGMSKDKLWIMPSEESAASARRAGRVSEQEDVCSTEPTCTRCTMSQECGNAEYECIVFQYHRLGYCATRCSGPNDEGCPCGGSCVGLKGRNGIDMYYCLKPNGRYWCDSIYSSYSPSQLGAFMSTFFVVVCAASVLWMVLSQCAEGHAALVHNRRRGVELRRRQASAIRGNPQRVIGSHGTGRTPNSRGHSREEIARLPAETLTAADVPTPGESIDEEEVDLYSCAVCLDDFASGDRVTRLPCIHRYHSECISKWLANSSLCPVCKQNAFGDPKTIVQPKNAAAKLRERALARKRLVAAQAQGPGEVQGGGAGSPPRVTLGARIRQFFSWSPPPRAEDRGPLATTEGGAPAAEGTSSPQQECALVISTDGEQCPSGYTPGQLMSGRHFADPSGTTTDAVVTISEVRAETGTNPFTLQSSDSESED